MFYIIRSTTCDIAYDLERTKKKEKENKMLIMSLFNTVIYSPGHGEGARTSNYNYYLEHAVRPAHARHIIRSAVATLLNKIV